MTAQASDSMFLFIDFVHVTNCFYDYDYDYEYSTVQVYVYYYKYGKYLIRQLYVIMRTYGL